jgi:hypothetical protein
MLQQEMKRYRCDVLGVAEMRWTKSGEIRNGEIIWSGKDTRREAGVGFLLSRRARESLLGYMPVNERIIMARFAAVPFNTSVIQVYAPTSDSTDDVIDQFYHDLKSTIQNVPKQDVLIIGGDWNASIGKDNNGWEAVMGKYGFGNLTERGEMLLEFALEQDLMICNTKFQQKDCRKWTWRSFDGKTNNMIDMILISKRWSSSVQQCRSFQGADIDSDHSLVIANIKMKLRQKQTAPFKRQRDTAKLAQEVTGQSYKAALHLKLGNLDEDGDMDVKMDRITKAITEAVEETVPELEQLNKKWITQPTLKLIQEKRALKIRRDDSEGADRLYKDKCNEVKKAVKVDKAKWLEDQCLDIERYYGEFKTREVYKLIRSINRKWQPRQRTIQDSNGAILMEKEDIMQRWTTYCSELYEDNLDKDISDQVIEELAAISPPGYESTTDISREEVEQAIRRLKNNKSPGNDAVTGEMIKYAGDAMVNEIHKLCNEAWNQGKAPKEWSRSVLVPLYKKGNAMDCRNYRTIALNSHVGKILMKILADRLKNHMERYLSDEQAGFRRDRSTTQQILALRLIAEKARRINKKVYVCFVDFQKAFDSIDQRVSWAVLQSYGVDGKLIRLLKNINNIAEASVRTFGQSGNWFPIRRGTRQGDPISPSIFIAHLERAMGVIQEEVKGISVSGIHINNLRFADDITLIEESEEELAGSIQRLHVEAKRYGLNVNIEKTETMVFGAKEMETGIEVDGVQLKNVEQFTYLGSMMTHDLNCKKEIWRRMAIAKANLIAMDNIWKSKAVSLKTKLSILHTCIFSSVLYGCEAWVLTKESTRKILAFERTCYRKILRIGWTQRVSNEDLYDRIRPSETLLQKVIKRKLQLFGHICRMDDSRKIKTLMLGEMVGRNRRGRPHRTWADDVVAWGGESLQRLHQLAQDREGWKNVVKMALDTNGR